MTREDNSLESLTQHHEQMLRKSLESEEAFKAGAEAASKSLGREGLAMEIREALGTNYNDYKIPVVELVVGLNNKASALQKEVFDLVDALRWCSGSDAFTPGGIAHVGWQKICEPLLAKHPSPEMKTELPTLSYNQDPSDLLSPPVPLEEATRRCAPEGQTKAEEAERKNEAESFVNKVFMKEGFLVKKPPLGLQPEWLWKELRVKDILRAMVDYALDKKAVPPEWVWELSKLTGNDKESQ